MSKINETNYPRRTQANYADTDMLIIQAAGGNTYTTRIEDLRDDCQETIAPIVEAVNDALAPPENGSTASQSYAIGEHFMRNGDFCTAIAAITSGASFTLNTNYVVGTIAEALESLNSELTVYHSSNLTFNSNGKYLFDDDIKCISARVSTNGNYSIFVSNSGVKTVFLLYNTEGTAFTRVTSEPTLNVEWWTQP